MSIKKLIVRYSYPVTDRIINRRFLLSYPKCGKTWLLNVFINYLWRRDNHIEQPLEFFYEPDNHLGKKLYRDGILFTHGFHFGMNIDSMIRTLRLDGYENRKTCLVIRNPSRTLYSYYCHIHDHEPDVTDFMNFIYNNGGIEHLCAFYDFLILRFRDKKNVCIMYYEDLHEKNPEHMDHFEKMFRFYFGEKFCGDSMQWAVTNCYFDKLKQRNDEKRQWLNRKFKQLPRVREGKASVQSGEFLEDMTQNIMSALEANMSEDVFSMFRNKYFQT